MVVPKSSSGARYLQTQVLPLVSYSEAWVSISLPDSLRQPGLQTASPGSDRLVLSALQMWATRTVTLLGGSYGSTVSPVYRWGWPTHGGRRDFNLLSLTTTLFCFFLKT